MKEPIWVRRDVVLAVHRRQLAEHGGLDGIRDEIMLDSALARAPQLFAYSKADIPALAASYASGIARNHPFIDGNKRSAFVTCQIFIRLNGFKLVATQEEKYRVFLQLAEGTLSEEALATWLRSHSRQEHS